MPSPTLRSISVTAITLLGVALTVEHFLDAEHYNPGFYEYPLTISLHVLLGGLYLGLGLLQFSSRLRLAAPAIHRWSGRLVIAAGMLSGVLAVIAIILFPFSGPVMLLFVAPFAAYFLYALGRGYLAARERAFDQHRQWMIRAFAIASGIATQRLILLPLLAVFGTAEDTIRNASVAAFTTAFLLHAGIAEYWLRRDAGVRLQASP